MLFKQIAEKRLRSYRDSNLTNDSKFSKRRDQLIEDYHKFKLQLITISGGTIPLYIALQGDDNIKLPVSIGLAFLGTSFLLGIISLYLNIVSKEQFIAFDEEITYSGNKGILENIAKDGVDVSFDLEMLDHHQRLISEENTRVKKRYSLLTDFMKFCRIDQQKIEDSQLITFLLGIIFIISGILIAY